MAGARYFGRKYRLILGKPGGGKLVDVEVEEGRPAMDIKFDVTYARGQTAREGTLSILGLGWSTIHSVLKLAGMTRGKAMSQLVTVKLEAGYFTDAGMCQIFDGFAWYATVTAPPTMWLNIKVSEYNPLGGTTVTIPSAGPMSMKAMVEYVVNRFSGEKGEGVSFTVEDKTEDLILENSKKKVSTPTFPKTVSLSEAIKILSETCSPEIEFIMKTDRNNSNCRQIIAIDKENKKSTKGEVVVNGNRGLLSVTGIDAINGCITTFIDGGVTDDLSHLNLTSVLNPQANGRYYITKKQFVGHYMGQEWYTRYFCSAREGDGEK